MSSYTEDSLVEQPAIALFAELGWETADCFEEQFGPQGTLGRATPHEVILPARLRPALERLNPGNGKSIWKYLAGGTPGATGRGAAPPR